MKPSSQHQQTASVKASKRVTAGMKTENQREKPRLTAEPALDQYKQIDPDSLSIRVIEPLWLSSNYFEALKQLAAIRGSSWESLLWMEIQNSLHTQIERMVGSPERLGREYSEYLARKYEIRNVIPKQA